MTSSAPAVRAHRRTTLAVVLCAGLTVALTACAGEDPDKGTNGVGKLTASQIEKKALAAAGAADAVRLTGKLVSKGGTYTLNMQLSGKGGTGSVTSKQNTFALLRIGDELFLKADAGFWKDEKADDESDQAADKLGGKYVKVPEDDPTYQQLRGFTEKKTLLDGMLSLHGEINKGDRDTVGGVRTVQIMGGKGEGAHWTSPSRALRIPCGWPVAVAAGRSPSPTGASPSRWRHRPRTTPSTTAASCPGPPADGAGQRFPRRFSSSRGSAAGAVRRVVAPVGSGGAASEVSGRSVRDSPGASRTTRHSRAQRSVICSASGAFSRLPLSSPTAASHSSECGSSTLTAAVQATSLPPLSLLRTVTSAAAPASSPAGSGCSPGPSPTSTAAPSCHTCHSAREGPVPRTQIRPDFLVASSTRARASNTSAAVMPELYWVFRSDQAPPAAGPTSRDNTPRASRCA